MKNAIQNIKDIAHSIKEQELIVSTSQLIHNYEHNTIDEYDLYALTRNILGLISDITTLRNEIDSLA